MKEVDAVNSFLIVAFIYLFVNYQSGVLLSLKSKLDFF